MHPGWPLSWEENPWKMYNFRSTLLPLPYMAPMVAIYWAACPQDMARPSRCWSPACPWNWTGDNCGVLHCIEANHIRWEGLGTQSVPLFLLSMTPTQYTNVFWTEVHPWTVSVFFSSLLIICVLSWLIHCFGRDSGHNEVTKLWCCGEYLQLYLNNSCFLLKCFEKFKV